MTAPQRSGGTSARLAEQEPDEAHGTRGRVVPRTEATAARPKYKRLAPPNPREVVRLAGQGVPWARAQVMSDLLSIVVAGLRVHGSQPPFIHERTIARMWSAFEGDANDKLLDAEDGARLRCREHGEPGWFSLDMLAVTMDRADFAQLAHADRRTWLVEHIEQAAEIVQRGAMPADDCAARLVAIYARHWPGLRRLGAETATLARVLAMPKRGRRAAVLRLLASIGLDADENTVTKHRKRLRRRLRA